MKKVKRWTLITTVLVVLATHATAVAPFKKVSIATSTTTSPTTATSGASEAPAAEADEIKSDNATSSAGPTKNSKLTGIPQIDYIWDPNLPRELRGYNLSSYPFFSTVPPDEDIHFVCDGLHDGFYASIEHKCQVYHHCVYGIRHDFLCANFTAFDQKTFICHFVSDVDCEGSPKYWSRNDNLYMATTTTSTTTTTTEPPPVQRRRPARPLRPLRRPVNRRPVDDYYYDDEEYDDDYYEERLNQRRKQRPRHRKPQLDYDEEYDEKRSFGDEEKPRRHNSRDRFRDSDLESDDDYDSDRRKTDRSKTRNKSNPPAERRKAGARRPGAAGAGGRAGPGADERRSFGDERPINGRKDKTRPVVEGDGDTADISHRRVANGGRRRANEKRSSTTASTVADIDDLDYYEKPDAHTQDQGEAADEEAPPKVKTTPKPLEEFITPKAPGSSVYSRPRAPPRISRPVPVNEKKKFEYPVQKTTATTVSPAASNSDGSDYEDYSEYDEPPARPRAPSGRRRTVDDGAGKSDDFPTSRRRTHNDGPYSGRKSTRPALRKPFTEKKPAEDDYDTVGGASNEHFDSRTAAGRKRLHNSRRGPGRGTDEMDFVDDDYEEQPSRPAHRLRPKTLARKSPPKSRQPADEEEDLYEGEPEPQVKHRTNANNNSRHRTGVNAKLRQSTALEANTHDDVTTKVEPETEDTELPASNTNSKSTTTNAPTSRPASVRVVKRPFLPSRGGSPYLPRGLQPVGIAHRPTGAGAQTTDSTPIDMGSTISGVRLLEHGAPILRDTGNDRESLTDTVQNSPRTTLPPRSAIPIVPKPQPEPQLNKATLDELYETDYDVTLNDALNPTLKPLSPHPNHHHSNRNYASAYASTAPGSANPFVNNNQSPAIYHSINNNNNNKFNNDNYPQQHQIAYQSLSPHQPQSQLQSQTQTQALHQSQPHNPHQHQNQQHLQHSHQTNLNNYNSDSYFSSTDIRRRAIIVPAPPAQPNRSAAQYRGVGTRIAQHFYDDFDY